MHSLSAIKAAKYKQPLIIRSSAKAELFCFYKLFEGAHSNVFNLAILIDLREEFFLTKNLCRVFLGKLARLAAPRFELLFLNKFKLSKLDFVRFFPCSVFYAQF